MAQENGKLLFHFYNRNYNLIEDYGIIYTTDHTCEVPKEQK